jgi:S1-C subfamily serine protease
MATLLASLSDEISVAADKAAASVVQVLADRPAAGVVVHAGHVVTPALTDDDRVAVRGGDGQTYEGKPVGRLFELSLTVVRVDGLGAPPLAAAPEPRPGHVALAIGRTWSGGVMAALAPIAVVGGPLRTARVGRLERVIRIQQPPHGALVGGALVSGDGRALGIITAMAIRGTTVVVPAGLAWEAAAEAVRDGGVRRGFLGLSSLPVPLPDRQRGGRSQQCGLLVSHVVSGGPAEAGGVLVGDLIVAFASEAVQEPADLLARLTGDRIGRTAPLTVIRGTESRDLTVTVAERPRG